MHSKSNRWVDLLSFIPQKLLIFKNIYNSLIDTLINYKTFLRINHCKVIGYNNIF